MKKWPVALFASSLIVAMAILFAANNPAESQARGAGFMMASGSSTYAWRVNTTTGAVSYCVRRSDSIDPAYIAANPPVCSGWTAPAPQ